MNIFNIVGPIMIGPSSSHTAGACRIGNVFRRVYGSTPQEVFITFYGSFADTYEGHGTDKAIIGGLLGYETDDPRIPLSVQRAEELGVKVHFIRSKVEKPHPNTVLLSAVSENGHDTTVLAESVGGVNIIIKEIDGVPVNLDGSTHAIVISHHDEPGVISYVTDILTKMNINVANMIVSRIAKGERANMFLEIDELPETDLKGEILKNKAIYSSRIIKKL